jgi:hypothetical protein
MAVTVAILDHNITLGGGHDNNDADSFWVDATITMDSSYPTGGEAYTAASLNTAVGAALTISAITHAMGYPGLVVGSAANAFHPEILSDGTDLTIWAYETWSTTAATQIGNTTDLSGQAFPVRFRVNAS